MLLQEDRIPEMGMWCSIIDSAELSIDPVVPEVEKTHLHFTWVDM